MNKYVQNQFYNKVAFFEGFRSRPYKCPAGVLTIGYGHTKNVKSTDRVDVQQAMQLMREDFHEIFTQLSSISDKILLQEHELWAIADFIFNLGFTKFKKSSLFTLLCEYSTACNDPVHYNPDKLANLVCSKLLEYNKYHNSSGKLVASSGLTARRQFEVKLFKTGLVY